jgi:UDP-N-acetylmuramate-alanine ligase
LNGIAWDHTDVFKTESQYIENFKEFVKLIPKDGYLLVDSNNKNAIEIAKEAISNVEFFSSDFEKSLVKPDWYLMYDSKPFPCVVRAVKGNSDLEIIPFEREIIGKINDKNILASIVLARILNIKKANIQKGIKSFKGIKRRMEIRYQDKSVTVVDDFGSTPGKAKQSLKTLKEDFPGKNNIVIFEPSAGSRTLKSFPSYKGSFDNSDVIFIPKFSILGLDKDNERFDEIELTKKLSEYRYNAKYIPDDNLLVNEILQIVSIQKNTIVIFMGSHSFRKIIQNLIQNLKNGKK